MRNIYFTLLLAVIFYSCERNDYQEEATDSKAMLSLEAPPPAEDLAAESNMQSAGRTSSGIFAVADVSTAKATNIQNQPANIPVQAPQKKLIKNGSLAMQVEDYAKTRPKINQLIAKHNGYIGSENESNTGSTLQNHITIRVPFNTFDALVNDLEKEAKYVENKSVNVQDVTAKFVDLESRLKTRREVMERYMSFLKKAKNIEETLKIEEQIRVIREEIESAEGQLKLMRDQVMYSTLQLHVYENLPYKVSPPTETGFFVKLAEAFKSGWRIMLSVIVGLAYLWPFIIAGLIVLFFLRKKIRR